MLSTVLVFSALFVPSRFTFDHFRSLRAVANLFSNNGFHRRHAVGPDLFILSGGIDLSVGAVVAATSILIASLIDSGVHPALGDSYCPTGRCLFSRHLLGSIIHFYQQPPFMITLGRCFSHEAWVLSFVHSRWELSIRFTEETFDR